MKYPFYPKYKSSDIPWLGDVPENWAVYPIKRRFKIIAGATPSSNCEKFWDGDIKWVTPSDIGKLTSLYIGNAMRNITEDGLDSCGTMIVPQGSIILTTRAPIGNLAITACEMCHNQGCKSLLPNKNAQVNFYAYLFSSMTEELNIRGRGTTFLELSRDELASIKIPCPPLPEQLAITAFLDRETKKIDDLIAEQQRLIDLIAEKRQAMVSHAVTRGLNPDAPMKSSGVDWLGDVPEHWMIVRLATLFSEVIESGDVNLPILQVSIHSGVSDDEIPDEERERKVARSEDKSKYKRVRPNDLVFNMMRAWQGAFGTVKVEGLVSPAYIVARPKKCFSTEHIEALLRTPTAVDEIKRFSRGITDFRLRLYWEEFKNIQIPLPPIDEQGKIISQLTEEDKKLELLRTEAERGIKLLRERRSALISAAVTGKICVVEHSAEPRREQKREANPFFRRSVFAAEIVARMHHEPTFGHVKMQKMLFLAENICNIDLATHYHRDAAGPYDNHTLRSVDSQLLKLKWFRCEKLDKGYRYVPLEKEGNHRQYFERYFSDKEDQLVALCQRFMTANTEQCEIVATLYSAWKDLLAAGHPSDDQIIDEVLNNWHPSKQRIPRERWQRALGWMREKNLCPLGDAVGK